MSNLGWFTPSDKLGIPDLWTPAVDLPALWLDPNDDSTVTISSEKFTSIENKGSLSLTFTQATTTKQPRVCSLYQKRGMAFDGVDDYMTSPSVQLHSGSWTIFAVMNASSESSGGSEPGRRNVLCQDYTSARLAQYLKTDGGTIRSIAFNTGGTVVYDVYITTSVLNPFVVSAFAIAGNSKISFFGGRLVNALAPASINIGSQECVLGARKPNSTEVSEEFAGNLYELLFYARALLPSEIAVVEGYLAHKWGLAK
jgi:hypothetical protein